MVRLLCYCCCFLLQLLLMLLLLEVVLLLQLDQLSSRDAASSFDAQTKALCGAYWHV